MSKITAPFTPEQVAALNRWQACPWVHPFTCCNEACPDHKDQAILRAEPEGWYCPACNYTQNWAHDFMLTVPPNPVQEIASKSYSALRKEFDQLQERLREVASERDEAVKQRDAWIYAAVKTRLCRADIDVSTPEKYLAAQTEAAHRLVEECRELAAYKAVDAALND